MAESLCNAVQLNVLTNFVIEFDIFSLKEIKKDERFKMAVNNLRTATSVVCCIRLDKRNGVVLSEY